MATAIEDHPDNVGASLFGGFITAVWDGEHADYVRMEPHEDLEVLVVIPDFQLKTSEARKVLPEKIGRKDAVYNISRSSLLVAAGPGQAGPDRPGDVRPPSSAVPGGACPGDGRNLGAGRGARCFGHRA